MTRSNEIYDACFITFTELLSDARTLNIANSLVRNGKKVAFIANAAQEEIDYFNNSGITLFPISGIQSKRVWFRWLLFYKKAKKLRNIINAKVYWASDLYSLATARAFASYNKSNYYYDSREIYSALGPLYKQKIKQIVISTIEKHLVKNAKKIIVSGELDAEYLKNYFKNDFEYVVIMNLPPYSITPKSNFIHNKYKLPLDSIVLIYQGMLLPGRGLEKAIESLKLIKNSYLVILGDGLLKPKLESFVDNLELNGKVFFAGRVPYSDLPRWTASADIGLVLIEPISLSYNLALPNKLFEYCMANIPSLVTDLPAMRKVIEDYDIGKLVPAFSSPKDIAIAIKDIISRKTHYVQQCEHASKYLNYESQEYLILAIISSL